MRSHRHLLGAGVVLASLAAAPPTSAAEVLLSRGRPATASSSETAQLSPDKAVDGNTATRWASAEGSDPQWLSVDLGGVAAISHVRLTWEAAFATAYQVQVSNDGTSWTTAFSTTTGDGGTDDIPGLAASGRFLRILGTRRGTQFGYSLFELEVFGPGAGPSPSPSPQPSPSPSPSPAPPPTGDGGISLTLRSGWSLQSTASATQSGATISKAGFQPSGWLAVTVPASVIAGQLQNGVYPDPYFGKNIQMIQAADFAVPWWYRREFTLPASESGKRVWLKLEGLNYRAEVWFNGAQLTDGTTTVGPFRSFELDVSSRVDYVGTNVIAVKVTRGSPLTTDLAISFVDWNPSPADWNMGILNDVVVSTSGPVIVRHPLVTTQLDLPSLSVAHLTVIAELTNGGAAPVSGSLEGTIGDVRFAQDVSLAAGETKKVTFTPSLFPQLNLSNPSLWWPWEYGTPTLQTLSLGFSTGGRLSDRLTTRFGIRQITSQLTPEGTRVFSVNGKPILIRGGAWAPDIFQRRTPERQEAEVRYVRDLNLNTIRFEGKFEDDHMFELTDAYGLLVMIGWNCCDAWQKTGGWTIEQKSIANESLRSLMYRLRNHPSMLVFLNGSDETPASAVEQGFLGMESSLQWPNPTLASAAATSSSRSGSTGVKMAGPYEWEPPLYWETDASHQGGGAWGFATEISPGPAVPPLESLMKFIPADHLWPIDSFWTFHCGGSPFNTLDVFTQALDNRYGSSSSAAEYSEKAQVAAYESHRAMFEAYGRKKYTAGGVIQWMMRNAWPSMIWHLYDYYLRPGGSYYGAKNALEPLHIQYSYADRAVVVVNSTLSSFGNLKASARVINLDGTQKFTNTTTLASVGPDSAVTAFSVPALSGLSGAYFLRLTLADAANNVVSLQTYWLSTKADALAWSSTQWFKTPQSAFADFTALSSLPPVNVTLNERTSGSGALQDHFVTATNQSSAIAFFVHLKITKGPQGEELLPITWQDNYFTLLPGESREIRATYSVADLAGAMPVVEVDTFNNR
jgi:exo-1,4-beta-D-glucosaminidase